MNSENTNNDIKILSGGLLDDLISLSLDKLVCSYDSEKGFLRILVSNDKFKYLTRNLQPNNEHRFTNIPFYVGEKGNEINPFLVIGTGKELGIYLVLNDNDKNLFVREKRPFYSITILDDKIKNLYINLFKTQRTEVK